MGLPFVSGRRGGALVLMATYGEGHRRAAVAVGRMLSELQPELPVDVVDFFEVVNPTVNRVARALYVGGVRHTPGLYGMWYRSTQEIREHSWVQRRLDRYGAGDLKRLLEVAAPRVVLSTFPIPAGVLSALRQAGADHTPSAVVVTDYTVHSQWLHAGVDRYYMAADDLVGEMARRGVPPTRVRATGIPVEPAFALGRRSPSRAGDRPQVMIMGGAYGMMKDAVRVAERVAALPQRPVVRVMAGRDRVLLEAASRLSARLGADTVIAQPFTAEIARLMVETDLLVTKAGGLTMSEGLALGMPMVIHNAIPGQEVANVAFLARHEAVRVAHRRSDLVDEVAALLADRSGRERLSTRALALGRPHAARDVAQDLVALMREGPERSLAG